MALRGEGMPFPEFLSYANRIGPAAADPAECGQGHVLYDVQDQTASAKLTAWWGTDYLLLAKDKGRWMILHVLWQSPPPK